MHGVVDPICLIRTRRTCSKLLSMIQVLSYAFEEEKLPAVGWCGMAGYSSTAWWSPACTRAATRTQAELLLHLLVPGCYCASQHMF